MGGLSCVAGKPPDTEPKPQDTYTKPKDTNTKSNDTNRVERRESQRPWNRHSLQVYCGDPKSESETCEDKPPDNTDHTKRETEASVDREQNHVAAEGPAEMNTEPPHLQHGINSTDQIIDKMIDLSENEDTDSESKDSVPDILAETGFSLVKFYPPPVIAPFDPNTYTVKKRPRSLDSEDNNAIRKSRPLSYSPGLLKTKHPRSLHCITENMNISPRKRPQSLNMSAFFEAKGFDIHTQKLRRVLTQKVKEKILQDIENKCSVQPGQVKYLDEGPSRCFQPSQMAARKKKNRDLKIKEIKYLKKALSRPRMNFSKSLEIFFQHNEQYTPYDPLLDARAAQPSNPWVTEDEAMWEVNRNMVEVPTVIRMKKWAVSFEDLLHDETGRNEFEQFLKKEYSQENITFYKACKEIVVCPNAKLIMLKTEIEKEFLTPGAACEVNVDCKTLEKVTAQLKQEKEFTGKTRYIFQPVMEHVYALMKKDSYTRFLRSDQYKQLMEKAQTHYTKKKFFNFGSNRKKTPSPLVHRRGSASSDGHAVDGADIGGPSYHSYSTGNLRDLDEKPKRSMRHTNSPSLRRRTEIMDTDSKVTGSNDPRRRSNLEVPRASFQGATDGNRKSETPPCLAINVPRTNVVTPWDGQK